MTGQYSSPYLYCSISPKDVYSTQEQLTPNCLSQLGNLQVEIRTAEPSTIGVYSGRSKKNEFQNLKLHKLEHIIQQIIAHISVSLHQQTSDPINPFPQV